LKRCQSITKALAISKTVSMKKELLMNEGGYEIFREEGLPKEALDLLLENSIGSTGHAYKHLNTAELVSHLSHPTTISLQKTERCWALGCSARWREK